MGTSKSYTSNIDVCMVPLEGLNGKYSEGKGKARYEESMRARDPGALFCHTSTAMLLMPVVYLLILRAHALNAIPWVVVYI